MSGKEDYAKIYVMEVPEHRFVVIADSRKEALEAVKKEFLDMTEFLLHEDNQYDLTDGWVH